MWRLDYVREVLTPAGQSDLDNYGLMSAIFDSAMYNKCSTAIQVVTYYYQPRNWDNMCLYLELTITTVINVLGLSHTEF